jgi:polyisoprenoid-binding protein YceI
LDFPQKRVPLTTMKTITLFLALTGLNLAAFADTENFDFKDPKGVNNVVFRTDAPLESINGVATNITGTVSFDAASPGSLKGKIVVETASLHVPNSMMQGHLQGVQWLDASKNPEITFEVTGLDNVKTDDNVTTADVTGNFTLHGVTKQINIPGVKITFLKDKLKDRFPMLQGDLLVIRAGFKIKRSDFDINKGKFEDKVSDEIQLNLSIAGQCVH